MIWFRCLRVPAVLLGMLALNGCGGGGDKFAPACPARSFLAAGADLTRFGGSGGHDVTDMAFSARMTGLSGGCKRSGSDLVTVTFTVAMEVQRGPAAGSRNVSLPFFVAVTEGSQILDRQDYVIPASFKGNMDTMTMVSDTITLNVPYSKDKSAAAYKVYVSFSLTQEELDYNRSRSHR